MIRDYLPRKQSIILSSIEIINENGMQGLTIRNIASRQDVSEAAIYRHFKNKEEILISILQKFSDFDNMIMNVVKEQNMNTMGGILFYIRSYAEYYENYPAITSVILNHDFFNSLPIVKEKMREILDNKDRFLTELIQNGKRNGEISSQVAFDGLEDAIQGLLLYSLLRWKMHNYNFNLKNSIMNTLCQMLHETKEYTDAS